METQITQAAKRFTAVHNVLKYATTPLTMKQIYEAPTVRPLCNGTHSVADTVNSLRKLEHVRRVPSSDPRAQHMFEVTDRQAIPIPPLAGSNRNKPKTAKKAVKKVVRATVIQEAPVVALPKVKVNNISGDIMSLPEITVTRTGVHVQTDKFKLTIEL